MELRFFSLLILSFMVLPTAALANSHSMDHSGHGNSAQQMVHGSTVIDMDKSVIMLPEQTVDSITALAHLKDVKATMTKMGMKHTHHFMLNFKDAKSGKALEAQVAAVKIVDPSGKEGEPVKLMSMDGHSGADVILATSGVYKFNVAVKLAGEKKVQYEFAYTVK